MTKEERMKELKPTFDAMTKDEVLALRDFMKTFDANAFDYNEDELDEFKSEALDWIAGELGEDYGNRDINEIVSMLRYWESDDDDDEWRWYF